MDISFLFKTGVGRAPRSSKVVAWLLIFSSCITASTLGYDGSMMNALNILPSYSGYFNLTTATLALNTSAIYIGSCIAGFVYGPVTDLIGRRQGMLWAALLTIVAAILQAASQNIGMFIAARILIGLGTGASSVAGPVYLAETIPSMWRAWALGLFYDVWYVGGLIAAGVTFGTQSMSSTWAWRIPSAVQGIFSIVCILILPWLPESPRWLMHKGRLDEALEVIAITYADGDVDNPIVQVVYREILDTLTFEKETQQTLSMKQMVKTPSARKRMALNMSVAVIAMLSGNNIISYYLGTLLDTAGVTNTNTQLEINIILNAWCLVCSLIGTHFIEYSGRKVVAAVSTGLLAIFLFMMGALTAVYGESSNKSGIYATVAAIFLFQGSYSIAWTPLAVLYPTEILSYPIRANGMAVYTVLVNGVSLLVTMAFPFALAKITWKTYMINASWDVLELAYVMYFWVETKGKTLEEIDALFEGEKHSSVPDLEDVVRGKLSFEVVDGVDVSDVVMITEHGAPKQD